MGKCIIEALLASVGVQAQDAQLRGRSSGPQPEPGNISGNAVDTYQEFQLVMGEGNDIGTVDHDADQTDVDVDVQEETTRTVLPFRRWGRRSEVTVPLGRASCRRESGCSSAENRSIRYSAIIRS